jgi:hypothetical protein
MASFIMTENGFKPPRTSSPRRASGVNPEKEQMGFSSTPLKDELAKNRDKPDPDEVNAQFICSNSDFYSYIAMSI